MGEEEQQIALQFFRALADESRLKIVGLLSNGERSVDELADGLKLRPPTVSHHLAKLREAGLVAMRADRTTHFYRLNGDALRQMSKDILAPEHIASLVDDVEGDAWDRKVLRQSFEGDRLKQIPMSRKKRDVILTFLAGRFEVGRRYTEKEVTEIITRHHEDYATLRRELIDGGWMERENGVYWLVDGERQPRGDEEIVRIAGEDGVRWRIAHRAGRRVDADR
ncbi:MAG TPA: metalloregulator ArsR/SmtB family transcription factor [Nitrolancea sp.]|nr:metalloregulator ArsR/SmtB family transcription factor [Nitrolancea sp.]